ncbi:MAG: hypothetical protein J0L77_05805 [Alphaproteobacteria bacterium]|nr:hypothetical protein [Alphaproteobacteria bacterium]
MISYKYYRKEKNPIYYAAKEDPIAWHELQLGTYKERVELVYDDYVWLEEYSEIVQEKTKKNIGEWIKAISLLDKSNGTCYLLFDSHDESTSWIKSTLVGDMLELQTGYSHLEGYHWHDTERVWVESSLPNFIPTSEKFVFSREEIINQLLPFHVDFQTHVAF